MTVAMLLAAGHGTRLRPLTDRLPKPLVPVGDRPIIAHLIDDLRAKLGPIKLVVNAHHKSDLMVKFLHNYDAGASVLVETELLGTAGGIRAALSHIGRGPVIVANSDILISPDYSGLASCAEHHMCTFCVSRRSPGLGSIGVDSRGNIVRLRGEVFGHETAGADYVGIAALQTDAVESLPGSGCLVGDWALPKLRRGESIQAYFDDAQWTDIGQLRSYAQANWTWLSARNATFWLASDARISAGVDLTDTIVGSGASIETEGSLRRVIVWPGAQVTEPLNDCVAIGGGQVVSLYNET